MIIKNPTNARLEVQIFGEPYVVEAESSVSGISPAVADYWKKRLHDFLIVEEEDNDKDILKEREKELAKEIEEKEKELDEKVEEAEKESDKEVESAEESVEETEEETVEESEDKSNKEKNE